MSELTRYMPLVQQLAVRLRRRRRLPASVVHDDLISAGRYGLVDALLKASDERDASFESYVRTRIRGAMLDELRREDWLTRGERRRAKAETERPHASASTGVVHMEDLPLAVRTGLVDTSTAPALEQLVAEVDRQSLETAIAELPDRERTVVRLYYLQDVPLTEVARTLCVTLPRASQLRARGLRWLHSRLELDSGPNHAHV